MPDRTLEYKKRKEGYTRIVGVDESGRGSLCGPVVVAAVCLPHPFNLEGINDSKKLSEKRREELFDKILTYPGLEFGIGVVDSSTIDKINVLQATFLGIRKALKMLNADYVYFDGNRLPKDWDGPEIESVIKGDSKCLNIAVASVIAKVYRDRMMREYDKLYPGWGFAKHKGYLTKMHIQKLGESEVTPIHRLSFDPIKREWRELVFA